MLSFTVTANAFLYHMVRRMVHIQVEIGLGKKPFSALEAALSSPGDGMIQGLAPAHGLFLRGGVSGIVICKRGVYEDSRIR